jgi:HSP20 family protein
MANLIRRTEQAPRLPTSWDPFELMREMMSWDPFRPLTTGTSVLPAFSPQFDVKETKDGYLFKADLPGIEEKDLDLTLTGNRLTISGKREAEEHEEGDQYFAWERSHGSFTRSFTLPEGVSADDAAAELKNGVLTVFVPKSPEKQPRKISLKGLAGKAKGLLQKESKA